ncbi:hypothetical protein I316_01214 [Kwoniella heveanensis BCC8398]|uniref:Fcf2 pre-rRNA processing C-terminal domain-containing protein n=1 Tax=Kwoniella heveanensis BCC8398 TaxID=1296120 RepID=A0A1B9H221_9TREE|nr:hypothetical protein I316_01214 [Kwoniella heveanensis BCC8398]
MPTPRRSRSTTPASTPSQKTRASSRTPTIHQHHKTADELAAEEAASLLTPTTARLRLRSDGPAASPDILDGGSARALRHRRLNEVREEGEVRKEKEEESSTASQESREKTDDEEEDIDAEAASATIADENRRAQPLDHTATSSQSSTGDVFATQQAQAGARSSTSKSEIDTESESGSDSASSSSGSTSDTSDSDSDPESQTDETDDEDERMEQLLQAAKAAAIAKASSFGGKGKERASDQQDEEGETVLQFDEDLKEKKKDAPIPDLSIPKLPKPHLAFTQDGRASASTQLPLTTRAVPSKRTIEGRKARTAMVIPELDDRPYERELSKREKAAQPRKATTSELWATIPTPRSDLLPQMKKDYQALALTNSLDPKRFMKGGSRSDKVPESFAIGTMVDAPRHLQATTLTKERKYRAGEVVQGLIKDDTTGDYAKRKYGDLQWSKMENGRGKGWKKRSKW